MDNPNTPPSEQGLTNFHQFEQAYPLLAMACRVIDHEGDPDCDSLWEICVSTALCRRFDDAEREMSTLSAPQYLAVVHADPGEELEFAPIACRVLTGIFA